MCSEGFSLAPQRRRSWSSLAPSPMLEATHRQQFRAACRSDLRHVRLYLQRFGSRAPFGKHSVSHRSARVQMLVFQRRVATVAAGGCLRNTRDVGDDRERERDRATRPSGGRASARQPPRKLLQLFEGEGDPSSFKEVHDKYSDRRRCWHTRALSIHAGVPTHPLSPKRPPKIPFGWRPEGLAREMGTRRCHGALAIQRRG